MDELDLMEAEYVGGDSVEDAIAAGNRDLNALADLEFNRRHPERNGAKIEKGDAASAKEWTSIRDSVVRPALTKATSAPVTSAATKAPASAAAEESGSSGDGGDATMKRNRLIAGALGAVALLGIGVALVK